MGIISSQETSLDFFAKFASTDHLITFVRNMKASFYQQVEEMRSTALAKRQSSGFGVLPETWFATITSMLDVMTRMENLLAEQLKEKSASLADIPGCPLHSACSLRPLQA